MENRPPQQETPRRPSPPARKTNGSGGSPTPPWLWLLLIGGFAIIFWQFMPKPETAVVYHPFFLEQVDSRQHQEPVDPGQRDPRRAAEGAAVPEQHSTNSVPVRRFITYFPSEQSIDPVVKKLREGKQDQ